MTCACLGAKFNMPLSRVALFEDLLMLTMALVMVGLLLPLGAIVSYLTTVTPPTQHAASCNGMSANMPGMVMHCK